MKYSWDVACATPAGWIKVVLADFLSFLQDHADCERKASAMAMSLVAKYPDRTEILPELIETGVEELVHFQRVFALMRQRGIPLPREMKQDAYIATLLALRHSDSTRRFLDNLLLGSIIECRGAERFRLVAEALPHDAELQAFYHELWASEAKHGNIYVRMALTYFPEAEVYGRLGELNAAEGRIIECLPLRPALH